jgi:transcriptional regulator NrdR family protein
MTRAPREPALKFHCRECGAVTSSRVVETRIRKGVVRRRRECLECRATFATVEALAEPVPEPMHRPDDGQRPLPMDEAIDAEFSS